MANRNAATAIDQRYHAGHAARAAEVLRKLVGAGKTVQPADVRRCQDYALDVLGDRTFTPWLLVYSALAGEFRPGWIPDNFYGARVVPAIQGRHGHVSFLKSLSAAIFNSSPAFPDIGARINGALFGASYRPLSFDAARDSFFEQDDRILFKPDDSGRSRNIRFFDAGSFDPSAVETLGNGVFQRFVSQHPMFDQFSAASVATIRMTTVADGGGAVSLRAAHLRLGSGADTHVQPESQVSVSLDLASGALRDTGLVDWLECSAHPTSGEPFAGKSIPAFEQCAATVVAHHQRIPFVGCIGWDITVDSDEQPRILEWNGYHNGIIFPEVFHGPCFTDLGWERFA